MIRLLQNIKRKIGFYLIFSSSLIIAQNFSPFTENVTKRFYNSADPTDNSYFFYADSITHPAPGKTNFYQYFTMQLPALNLNTSACGFWAGGVLYMADTTWLGVEILYDSTAKHLILKNFINDTLDFDFSILPGDSATFFENSTDKYYIKAAAPQNEAVYSSTDTIKTFTILHFDASNQLVNSPLNGKQIKLGLKTGLIRFFDTYHFPSTEKHLILKGQLNPLIGSYQMRFEDLYPFQVGDSLQYDVEPSSKICKTTVNYRVLSRTEIADSVTIIFGKSFSYHTDISVNPPLPSMCPPEYVYPDKLKFSKNSDLIGAPYNRLITTQWNYSVIASEDSVVFCGAKRLRYRTKAIPFKYCQSCACLGSMDAFEQKFPEIDYHFGLGIVTSHLTEYQFNPKISYNNQIYSSIAGQVCGTYFYVGLPKYELKKFSLHPNPATNELLISEPVDEMSIFSTNGTVVEIISQPVSTISISHLPQGLYIVLLKRGERTEYTKFIKS